MKEETRKALFSSKFHGWGTPQAFFDKLDDVFHFTLDVCASDWNAKCEKYYTIEDDGLSHRWYGTCWMNPPYRGIEKWMRKAWATWEARRAKVVCLIPVRADTRYFHKYAFDAPYILFIKGRLKFDAGPDKIGEHSATFPSCLVVFSALTDEQKRRLSKLGVLMEKVFIRPNLR